MEARAAGESFSSDGKSSPAEKRRDFWFGPRAGSSQPERALRLDKSKDGQVLLPVLRGIRGRRDLHWAGFRAKPSPGREATGRAFRPAGACGSPARNSTGIPQTHR